MSTERRSWLRADCDAPISVSPDAGQPLRGAQAVDIGTDGIGVALPVFIEVGAACTVSIRLRDGVTLSRLPATVAWCRPAPAEEEEVTYRAGLALGDLRGEQRAVLSGFVRRRVLAMVRRMREATVGLQRVSRFLDSVTDLGRLLESIMDEAKRLTDAEASSLLLWDAEREDLYFEVALGEKGDAVKQIRLKPGQGVAGAVALSHEVVNVPDVTQEERWLKEADAISGFRTRSILAVPMLREGRLVGVLEVLNRRGDGGFGEDDEANLAVLAGQAALAVENARLHREMMQAERLAAVGRTIAELAHCIKNILNGIQGGAYILDAGLARDDRKKLQTGWEMVRRNNAFLSDLVLDMLAYAKEREPHYEDTNVTQLVQTIADLLAARAKANGIDVTAEVDRSMTSVRVDRTAVYRALLNLGTNAVEACVEREGTVVLRGRPAEEGWFVLAVEDNGSGIAPEHRDRLFTEFFSTKGSKGTGLGLGVVAKIVGEHGGRVEVASELGKGTTFTLHLPVAGPSRTAPDQ